MNTAKKGPGITARQIKLIHIGKNSLRLDRDEYRMILRERYGVGSSKDLTTGQASDLLEYFKGLGFPLQPPKRAPLPRHESSLPGLREEVRDLARERWGDGSAGSPQAGWERPLNGLCRRFGVDRWQWLDVKHAKAIKAWLIKHRIE